MPLLASCSDSLSRLLSFFNLNLHNRIQEIKETLPKAGKKKKKTEPEEYCPYFYNFPMLHHHVTNASHHKLLYFIAMFCVRRKLLFDTIYLKLYQICCKLSRYFEPGTLTSFYNLTNVKNNNNLMSLFNKHFFFYVFEKRRSANNF